MNKVISFDLFADFGFFKKPFSNEKLDLYLTFNMIHKPALLGVLGAIIGLHGYKGYGKGYGKLPEYYKKLNSLRIGIEPIEKDKSGRILHEKGIFPKTTVKYNNAVGYANSQGGILNINEQILISPAYRCYILLDNSIDKSTQSKLIDYISNGYAEYLPYFGKNEFSCWWEKESYKEYQTTEVEKKESFQISSIFYMPENTLKDTKSALFDFFSDDSPYAYFERLPIGFERVEDSYQYKIEKFIYSSFRIKENVDIENIYALETDNGIKYVQLF